MENVDAPMFIFHTHMEAQDAIRSLGSADFDLKKLSLVGKGTNVSDRRLAFHRQDPRIEVYQ